MIKVQNIIVMTNDFGKKRLEPCGNITEIGRFPQGSSIRAYKISKSLSLTLTYLNTT